MATIIRHPFGNPLRIRIPLTERETKLEKGKVTSSDQDLIPNQNYTVKIIFRKGSTKYEFTPEIVNNVLQFTDNGTLPLGIYEMVIKFRDNGAHPMRYDERAILEIVEHTCDAGIQTDDDEISVESRYPVLTGESGIIDEDGYITFRVGRHFQEDQDPADDFADAGSAYGSGYLTVEEDTVTLHI
jgi:hypothetical protein